MGKRMTREELLKVVDGISQDAQDDVQDFGGNTLEPCIYCPGQNPPKSKSKRSRLRDTSKNRAREIALYRALGRSK